MAVLHTPAAVNKRFKQFTHSFVLNQLLLCAKPIVLDLKNYIIIFVCLYRTRETLKITAAPSLLNIV